ncbi:MAG TPA: hypothetical protein VF747_09210 [Blastocatellia bacterium]|jgi:hypothetical protein
MTRRARGATHRFCVHCERLKLVEEMEPLSCGLPSDCCKECAREIDDMLEQGREFLLKKWEADAKREREKGLR